MFDILAITAPIYIAIALGYGLTRWGFFQKADMRAFGTFVVKVAMPALLFNALLGHPGGALFLGLDWVGWLSYIVVCILQLGIFLMGMKWITRFLNWAGPLVYLVMFALLAVIWLIAILALATITALRVITFDMDIASAKIHGSRAGHVFNLGHGMSPDMNPDHVAVLVDAVHEFSAR